MRVLLTGASGFLGQYVLRRLQACGTETIVMGRSLPAECVPADFRQVDLLDPPGMEAVVADAQATHLLHLAWYVEHGEYWASPLNLRWVEASVRLVEAFCRAGGRKMLGAGTCAEYDWSYGYCSENLTPLNPATLYGVAKDATRRLSQAICAEHGTSFAWGRIFLPYGPGEDSRRLMPTLHAVFQGRCPPFGVNASAYRDFLHVDDLAAGFIHLLRSSADGAFNICSGQALQLADVVRQVAHLHGADPRLVLDLPAGRAGEPPLLVGNNQKLKALGWLSTRDPVDLTGRSGP